MSAGFACADSHRMRNFRRHPHRLAQATISSTITQVAVWHSLSFDAPGLEVWNKPQAVQLLGLLAPVLLEYLPAPQSMQLLEPPLAYRPAGHTSVQLLAPALLLEKRPASQAMQLLAPTLLEKRPASQAVQLLAPVLLEKRPTAQAMQPPLLSSLDGW